VRQAASTSVLRMVLIWGGLKLSFSLVQILVISFLISGSACLIIMLGFSNTTVKSITRNDISSVQAAHTRPTPRIGGLAIVLGLVVVSFIVLISDTVSTHVALMSSALPVFVVGLAEDLGKLASPRNRLLAAAVSGALFILLMGQWLPRTDIPVLDLAMLWVPFAVSLSLFLSVGISHAFNLIDGLNGLAATTAMVASLALALIAHQAGLLEHRNFLFILSAAIAGFLVFNFPFGKIFLGDAGAYVLGHLLVWTSISILWNVPSVTPLAALLIFFWPIADTILAILRRYSSGKPITQPDRLHFHQLVMRAVEIVLLGRNNRKLANPLATILTLPFVILPMIAGVLFAYDPGKAAIACAFFGVTFFVTYKVGMWSAPKLRRSYRLVSKGAVRVYQTD
jgi:UDP-GlcNAc:undecaprenyl-phosphate/decaprenyl-phosphate GlcNAc-1-phosphate transferase